jgi:deazaflavin-dependent oxidoreductase (nitroreductase family)
VRRRLFRLPILLYRARLGWLLGHRFVLINHIGRRTGRERQVVVEVVARDRATGAVTVAAGFGPGTDWYRNLRARPEATIRIATRRIGVRAVPLTAEQGSEVMAAYARRHPRAARGLSGFMGFSVDGSDDDYRAVGREIPFVRLEPRA